MVSENNNSKGLEFVLIPKLMQNVFDIKTNAAKNSAKKFVGKNKSKNKINLGIST